MTEKKIMWVAYTNTDLTEGRGRQVPIAVCTTQATAIRLGRYKYIQGSDCPIDTVEFLKIDGKWYASTAAINVVEPTGEDVAAQAALDAKQLATNKAKAAGLTDADLLALGTRA